MRTSFLASSLLFWWEDAWKGGYHRIPKQEFREKILTRRMNVFLRVFSQVLRAIASKLKCSPLGFRLPNSYAVLIICRLLVKYNFRVPYFFGYKTQHFFFQGKFIYRSYICSDHQLGASYSLELPLTNTLFCHFCVTVFIKNP